MNILEKIAGHKRAEVKNRKITDPVSLLEQSVFFNKKMPSFYEALNNPFPSVIGEFKRKSPSKGEINRDADLIQVALGYQAAGIAAMSVLTDEEFFGGKNSDIRNAAGILNIPVLRKDFIVDEYQVIEAKSTGASAVLLIASILSKREVNIFSGTALDLGMDVLFEIHDMKDLDKINQNIKIVGVNNRDLKTLKVSMDNSNALFKHLPDGCLKVAESGFQTNEDVRRLFAMGYNAFLIGEYFMKSGDPGRCAALFMKNLRSEKK